MKQTEKLHRRVVGSNLSTQRQISIQNSTITGSNIGNGNVTQVNYTQRQNLIRAGNLVQVRRQTGGNINMGGNTELVDEESSCSSSSDSDNDNLESNLCHRNTIDKSDTKRDNIQNIVLRDAKSIQLDSDNVERLVEKLEELGVVKADDLLDVEELDISPDPLTKVKARQLIQKWKQGSAPAQHFESSLLQSNTNPPAKSVVSTKRVLFALLFIALLFFATVFLFNSA